MNKTSGTSKDAADKLVRGIKGAMDGPAFAAYIREVLVPEITPGTVVILDSLATHRNREAAQVLRYHVAGSCACHPTHQT